MNLRLLIASGRLLPAVTFRRPLIGKSASLIKSHFSSSPEKNMKEVEVKTPTDTIESYVVKRAVTLKDFVSIVGTKGSGLTTLGRQLEKNFTKEGFFVLNVSFSAEKNIAELPKIWEIVGKQITEKHPQLQFPKFGVNELLESLSGKEKFKTKYAGLYDGKKVVLIIDGAESLINSESKDVRWHFSNMMDQFYEESHDIDIDYYDDDDFLFDDDDDEDSDEPSKLDNLQSIILLSHSQPFRYPFKFVSIPPMTVTEVEQSILQEIDQLRSPGFISKSDLSRVAWDIFIRTGGSRPLVSVCTGMLRDDIISKKRDTCSADVWEALAAKSLRERVYSDDNLHIASAIQALQDPKVPLLQRAVHRCQDFINRIRAIHIGIDDDFSTLETHRMVGAGLLLTREFHCFSISSAINRGVLLQYGVPKDMNLLTLAPGDVPRPFPRTEEDVTDLIRTIVTSPEFFKKITERLDLHQPHDNPYPYMYMFFHALRSYLRRDLTLYPEYLPPPMSEMGLVLANSQPDYSDDMAPVEGCFGDNIQEMLLPNGDDYEEDDVESYEIQSLAVDIPCRTVIVLEDSEIAASSSISCPSSSGSDAQARKILFEVSTDIELSLKDKIVRLDKTRIDYGASFAWLVQFQPSGDKKAVVAKGADAEEEEEEKGALEALPCIKVLTIYYNDVPAEKTFSSIN